MSNVYAAVVAFNGDDDVFEATEELIDALNSTRRPIDHRFVGGAVPVPDMGEDFDTETLAPFLVKPFNPETPASVADPIMERRKPLADALSQVAKIASEPVFVPGSTGAQRENWTKAKLDRIANIAEAGEPDEDWKPISDDAGDPDHCPKCGSKAICQNTLNAAEDGDWACMGCDARFFADDPSEFDGPRRDERHQDVSKMGIPAMPTMAERAEEAARQPDGEPFIVVGVYRDVEEGDGSLQRFADEYASATGWEGAEAAAKEEHPTLDVAAVLKVEDGKVRVCDAAA